MLEECWVFFCLEVILCVLLETKKTTSNEMSKNKQIPELKLEKDVREKDSDIHKCFTPTRC